MRDLLNDMRRFGFHFSLSQIISIGPFNLGSSVLAEQCARVMHALTIPRESCKMSSVHSSKPAHVEQM